MIIIGSDHAGFPLKCEVIEHLKANGVEFFDFGCYSTDSVDYPLIAEGVCRELLDSGKYDKAILICGTGIGISMAANKVDGIRAALCTNEFMAKYTRLHNDANVLCMGARVTGGGVACEIADVFLSTEFEGGRHQRRVDQIKNIKH